MPSKRPGRLANANPPELPDSLTWETAPMTVPGRKRRSGEEIKRLVLEFEASGLRQNEFCRNHGLALSTLQRQLRKRRVDQINPGVLRPETLERKARRCKKLSKR
jgi:hypothetical protein